VRGFCNVWVCVKINENIPGNKMLSMIDAEKFAVMAPVPGSVCALLSAILRDCTIHTLTMVERGILCLTNPLLGPYKLCLQKNLKPKQHFIQLAHRPVSCCLFLQSLQAENDIVGHYHVGALSRGLPKFWDGSSNFQQVQRQTLPPILLFTMITISTGINKWCPRKMNFSITIPAEFVALTANCKFHKKILGDLQKHISSSVTTFWTITVMLVGPHTVTLFAPASLV